MEGEEGEGRERRGRRWREKGEGCVQREKGESGWREEGDMYKVSCPREKLTML